MKSKIHRFRDVAINKTFNFAPSTDGFHHDRNTYRRLTARTYTRIDETGANVGPAYRVGSINVTIEGKT